AHLDRIEAGSALRALQRWARDRGRTDALVNECARYPETARMMLEQRGVSRPAMLELQRTIVAFESLERRAPARQGRGPALRLVPREKPQEEFRLELFGAPVVSTEGVPVRAWGTQLAPDLLFYPAFERGPP